MNMNFVKYPAVIGAAMILVAATPQGGTLQGQDQDKRTSQGFVLKAGDHLLQEVIQNAARFLGRNYLTTDSDFANSPTITLDKTLNLDVFGCEEVVSQLAYTKNFAMTPVDVERGIYEFIFIRGPGRPEISARSAFMKPEEILRRPKLKMMITTAVHLENADARQAASALRPFFAGGGSGLQISSAGSNRTLLLAGFPNQLATAIRLLQEVDRAGKATPTTLERLEQIERRLTALEHRTASKK